MSPEAKLPSVEEIHRIHELIEETWNLPHRGTRALMPDRTLQFIREDVGDLDGAYRRAAALLSRLANAHVYEDGNKRTSWTVARPT